MNRWYLEISGTNLAYTVRINDIVIFSDRWQTSKSDACPLNQWLVPGINKLQVNLGVGLGKSSPDQEPTCSILIKEVDLRNPNAPQKVVAEIVETFSERNLNLPYDKTVEFEGPNIPVPRWQMGELFSPDQQSFIGLNEFIANIHTMLSEKNLESIFESMRIKSEEMAVAYGVSLEERKKDQIEFFEDLFNIPEWEMMPFDPKQIFIQVEGDGRLLKVTDPIGNPIIKTKDFDDESNFGFKFYLCNRDGMWEVAR